MEAIIRSASSKYRTKIDRDLEELEAVRRRVKEMGDMGIKDPVTPTMATKIWGRGMSTFEKGEIVDYANVWFCSDSATVSKVARGDPISMSATKTPENATQVGVANYGFDDDIGNYIIVQGDHLAYRYEIVGILGKGSFGQVCKCLDHKTGKIVAVKIIRNKQRFHTQALVEVNILQKLCQWVCLTKAILTVGCRRRLSPYPCNSPLLFPRPSVHSDRVVGNESVRIDQDERVQRVSDYPHQKVHTVTE